MSLLSYNLAAWTAKTCVWRRPEAQRLAENQVSAPRLIEENRRIALNDPRRFVDSDGNLKPMTAWTAEMAAAVSKIEVIKKNAAAGAATPTRF